MHRRQRRQLVIASFLAVIAVINILFFFILLNPARSAYYNLQGSIDSMNAQIAASRIAVSRLQKTSQQLESFDKDRDRLFSTHFIKLDPGFADLSPRLEQLAVQSGVLRPVVEFTRDEVKQYGLYSVTIHIPVKGTYSNAVNFIKTLETSDTFFLINSVGINSSDAAPAPLPGPGNAAPANSGGSTATVALALSLETFFYK